jgi:putative glutamine amidotransferase
MKRPLIGVVRWEDVPGEPMHQYWRRVDETGGAVLDIDRSSINRVPELAPHLDGLVLTGGLDVDPARYGAERHPKVRRLVPQRDALELELLRRVLDRDVPVLAICRGHQVLNVAFGGSLLQHIDSGEHRADYRTEGYPSRWHDVRVEAGTWLAEALGATGARVNSRHHQAVLCNTLGAGLRPVAFADADADELVEGVESEQHRCVIGVQWHPERAEPHEPSFAPMSRRLFAAFVDTVRGRR